MDENSALDKVVARVGDLPAMPEIVAEVLRLTEDPNTALSEVSDAIQRDPALTAKILRVSNSPYYGMKQYVGTLKLALVILGVREIRNIVMGISVFAALRDEYTAVLLAQDLWRHSVMVGALAKKLATHMELGLQGEDFIAGLLHDIGKMVLARQLRAVYAQVDTKARTAPSEPLFALEARELGFNHAEAGAALACRWNLPSTLVDALWLHHPNESRPLSDAKDAKLAALIRIANLAAHEDNWEDPDNLPAACQDGEAWQVLASVGGPESMVERRELLAGFTRDLKAAPVPAF